VEVPVSEEAKTGVVTLDVLRSYDGLSFLKAMIYGAILQPPMTATLGFRLTEAEHGRAVFTGEPRYEYYNPLGSVHAGFAATLLDSALGCAVHSTLAKGESYVTAEFKLNLVRPLTKDTGSVTAEGRIVHRGRTLGTSEGYLRDAAGKLCAHATTTCIIFPATG
jgi:uncharacterized protein (TIGR00369 family)